MGVTVTVHMVNSLLKGYASDLHGMGVNLVEFCMCTNPPDVNNLPVHADDSNDSILIFP